MLQQILFTDSSQRYHEVTVLAFLNLMCIIEIIIQSVFQFYVKKNLVTQKKYQYNVSSADKYFKKIVINIKYNLGANIM